MESINANLNSTGRVEIGLDLDLETIFKSPYEVIYTKRIAIKLKVL